MGLVEGFAELVAPSRCAGCDLPGGLLCNDCDRTLPRIDPKTACPSCGAPFGGLVCTECWETRFAFAGAVALAELDGAVARAVVLHKDAGERRLGRTLGDRLAQAVVHRWPDPPGLVTWVPPTAAALARRGFDHGRSLAVPVAAALGSEAKPLLARASARDQRRLGREARGRNSAGSFSCLGEVTGGVLIVDDVLTTGATLDSAAEALHAAGAGAVRVAVVARAW